MQEKSKKEPTIYDIAKALNLSPSTISRGLKNHPAISEATKKKINQTANKLNYQHNLFASNLRSKQTNTLGIITPRFDSFFMSTVIAGMEEEASAAGYNLILNQSLESNKKEELSVKTLFNSRVDGVMASLASDTKNLNHFKILYPKDIPIVLFDRVIEGPGITSVIIDNKKAGYDAVDHLIKKGCKRILHYGGSKISILYNERFEGYKNALSDNDLVFQDDFYYQGNFTEEDCQKFAKKVLQMNIPPDGIFVANDKAAALLINLLIKNGRKIPGDIAIVGFNNDPVSKIVSPGLTTIQYPGYDMGKISCRILLNILDSKHEDQINRTVLNHQLIIRESS